MYIVMQAVYHAFIDNLTYAAAGCMSSNMLKALPALLKTLAEQHTGVQRPLQGLTSVGVASLHDS